MRFALIFILIFNQSLLFPSNLTRFLKKQKINYANKTIVLIGLNGNDCANCYKGISAFHINLQDINFEDLYFIAGGITEREKKSFISNNLPNNIDISKFIIDNEFSYYLNDKSTSKICIVKNGKLLEKYEAKSAVLFNYKLLEDKQKKLTIIKADSIDVSDLIISKSSKCDYLKNNKYLLTDFRDNKIHIYNHLTKDISSFNISEYLSQNYKSELLKSLRDSNKVNESIELQEKISNLNSVNNSYFISSNLVDDQIYISYRMYYYQKYNNQGVISLMKPAILILDLNLKPIKNIFVPTFDNNFNDTYFDLINPYFNKHKSLLRVTSGKSKRDTLMALFKNSNDSLILEKYYNYTLKSHIPKLGDNGYPMFYFINLFVNHEDTFIYTQLDYSLKNINNNNEIQIQYLVQKASNNKYYSLNNIIQHNDKILIWANFKNNTTSFSYLTPDFSKTILQYNTKVDFNSIGIINQDSFFGLSVNDKYSYIYIFKLTS